jgi:hypothetical protein
MNITTLHKLSCRWLLCALAALAPVSLLGQDNPLAAQLVGNWVIDEDLSDNTDEQVENAIKAGGGKVKRRWFAKADDDYYRGGPPEQELYDRISYDDELSISNAGVEFKFEYSDAYVRVFHSDGRRRQSSANDFYSEGGVDFSLANFDGGKLVVEARPRDGGFTLETYSISSDGMQLTIDMLIQPQSFREPINLTRVFSRVVD